MFKVALVEPFMAQSHADWAYGYQQHSQHDVVLYTLPGAHWKWRMHGGAVELARLVTERTERPDLFLVSAMCDLTSFRALLPPGWRNLPAVLYFHENQLTYPWSETDPCRQYKRDQHYGFINYVSALCADQVWFNSHYHRRSFLEALPQFLSAFPGRSLEATAEEIAAKSEVFPVGLNFDELEKTAPAPCPVEHRPPRILWNHRWEYDKNPDLFFDSLMRLQQEHVPFEVIVLGESFTRQPAIFDKARRCLADRTLQWGFVETATAYRQWLWAADLAPVTSFHDYFGLSVIEALFCGCRPLLPHRLAYPEHLPVSANASFYYRDTDFLDALRALLQQPLPYDATPVRAHLKKYDWKTVAMGYDTALTKVAQAFGLS